MSFPGHQLPPDVTNAIERGQLIEAIKLLREATGLGLKEAKDAVDAYQRGAPASASAGNPRVAGAMPADVMAALQKGNKIEAIRLLRQHASLGLKEAKDAVEQAGSSSFSSSDASPQSLSESAPYPAASNLAPGEVPRSGGGLGWIAILAGLALLGYFLFGRG